METFSAQLALCEGNSPVTVEFASQRASNADFDVSLTWLFNKQSNDRWFETTWLSYTYNELMKCLWHDDVFKWKHFPRYWPLVRGNHRSPVNSPHKDQWRGALMFSLICAWTNTSAKNRDASDLRRHRAHYDVTVIKLDGGEVAGTSVLPVWEFPS